MKLLDKIIMLRKERGWSQEDFAGNLNVSRQAVSRWENGTALPDAQNILQISKLFNVTADYLLNDDYEDEPDVNAPAVEAEVDETKLLVRKKNHWYLIPAICLIGLLSACAIIGIVNSKNAVHTHPELSRVLENEVSPTCTEAGSHDEVIYCAGCGQEVLRTHIITGAPAHQFENEKCTVCGGDQRTKD